MHQKQINFFKSHKIRLFVLYWLMRLSTGTHNLRRLREGLGLQQKQFADVLDMSPSLLQKLEHGDRPITRRLAEDIAACTGISPEWLLRNRRKEPPVDWQGEPYTAAHYHRAQFKRLSLVRLQLAPPILVRAVLLQRYAEARDLFLRPEMHRHLMKFLLDLQLLCARYETKAEYPASDTAVDAIKEQEKRENPSKLYPGIIRDAERCYKATQRTITRAEQREKKQIARFEQFLKLQSSQ